MKHLCSWPRISDLLTEDGERITQDKAQCFSSFVFGVFIREDLTHVPTLDEKQFNSPLTSLSVNQD